MGSRRDDVPLLRAAAAVRRPESDPRFTVRSATTVGALFTSCAGRRERRPPGRPPEASSLARWTPAGLHTCGMRYAHRLCCWGFDGAALGDGGGRRNPERARRGRQPHRTGPRVSAGYDQTLRSE